MAIETFTFVASGHDSVIAAYKSIASAAEKTSGVVAKSARSEERARTVASNRIKSIADHEAKAKAKSLAYVARIRDRYFMQEQRAEERAAAKRIALEKRTSERVARERSKNLGKIGSRIGGLATGTVLGAGALAVAGVGAAARESIRLGELSNRISITGRGAGQKAVDPRVIQRELEANAIAHPGVKSEDLARGVGAYVGKTGDLDTAQKLEGTIATVSSASGAGAEDLYNASAAFSEKFNIKSAEEMQQALATIAYQGKAGAIEIKDLAGQVDELSAAAGAFNIGTGQKAVATLGGLIQIARRGTGSAEEAATSLNNVFSQLQAKSPELKSGKYGGKVNVYDKNGKTRNIQDILVDTISNVGGNNLEKKKAGLIDVFGIRGAKALNPLTQVYETAFNATKGTDQEKNAAGAKALREEFDKTINVAGGWSEILKDAAQAQTDSSAQLTAAWEEIKSRVGSDVVPALLDLTKALTAHPEFFQPFITAIGVTSEALLGLADFLKEQGLIKPKEKTYAKQQEEAETALKKFDSEHPTSPLSPQETAEREKLVKTAADAKDKAWTAPPKQMMSEEEFKKAYIAAGNPEDAEDNETIATDLYRGGKSNGMRDAANGAMWGTAWMFGGKETQAQEALRQQINDIKASAANEKRQQEKANNAAEKLGAAADKLSTAADALSKAKPFGNE